MSARCLCLFPLCCFLSATSLLLLSLPPVSSLLFPFYYLSTFAPTAAEFFKPICKPL